MGSVDGATPAFQVLDDPRPDDMSLPSFLVSKTRGFLPRADPIVSLPKEFDPLESLLCRMPIKKLDGEPGFLAVGSLGDAVARELPDLTDVMDKYRDNLPLMNALYRDYSFLASAYLLEPCHLRFMRGEDYGLGRQSLPRNISRPIARCAEITGFMPFMEYAGSYALYNYRLEDPRLGLEYANIRLIRAFELGLDPASSEAGFVLVHIDMVKSSGPLVAGACKCLETVADGFLLGPERRRVFNSGLSTMLSAMRRINNTMETMWAKSKPRGYHGFRTFIFGITSQSMFPGGVIYEGLFENEPQQFRGESGANDSMIPMMDNFLQVPMPDTPLTEILNDFRKYRPSNHREFLVHVRDESLRVEARDYALGLGRHKCAAADPAEAELLRESRALWLQIVDQVRDFRWRHWCFGKEYILKMTSHPTATGGSPIVTWLPNQLSAVLAEMINVHKEMGEPDLGERVSDILEHAMRQKETLAKEVEKYCKERGVGK